MPTSTPKAVPGNIFPNTTSAGNWKIPINAPALPESFLPETRHYGEVLEEFDASFDPAGKANTRVIFFMVIPTAASAFYLKLLAGLSQVFQKSENRDKLLEADTSEKLWKALIKTTRLSIQ